MVTWNNFELHETTYIIDLPMLSVTMNLNCCEMGNNRWIKKKIFFLGVFGSALTGGFILCLKSLIHITYNSNID